LHVKDAGGLSASTIGRLKDAWSDEHLRWSKRDLSAKRYVYSWATASTRRPAWSAEQLMVIIGATPEGEKELVGLIDGLRESTPFRLIPFVTTIRDSSVRLNAAMFGSASATAASSHPGPRSFTPPHRPTNVVLFARKTEHGIDDCLLGLGLFVHPRVS
jgi:transposase-like protein